MRDIPRHTRLSVCFPSISLLEDAQAYAETLCSRLQNVVFLWVGHPWTASYDPVIYTWDKIEELAAQEERVRESEDNASQFIQLMERPLAVEDVIRLAESLSI